MESKLYLAESIDWQQSTDVEDKNFVLQRG